MEGGEEMSSYTIDDIIYDSLDYVEEINDRVISYHSFRFPKVPNRLIISDIANRTTTRIGINAGNPHIELNIEEIANAETIFQAAHEMSELEIDKMDEKIKKSMYKRSKTKEFMTYKKIRGGDS